MRLEKTLHLASLLPVLGIAILMLDSALAQEYQAPRALEPLEGDERADAQAINKRGQVAGNSEETPVVWDRWGTPAALLLPEGYEVGEARGINKRGEVAGHVGDVDGFNAPELAIVWNRKLVPKVLPPPEGVENCNALSINSRRKVAGFCWNLDDEIFNPVRWSRKGSPKVLPKLPGTENCFALSINKRGALAGICRTPFGRRTIAVAWGAGKKAKVRALLPPEGLENVDSEARAINNRGHVAGWVAGTREDGIRIVAAVIWNARGIPRKLEMPPDFDEEEDGSQAYAINKRGQAAGVIRRGIGDVQTAVTWDRKGRPIELEAYLTPPARGRAMAINNGGQVAGASDPRLNTAVVWDPVGR